MQIQIATQGTRQVLTTSNDAEGPFWSRLYVNNGETATMVSATHKSLKGAAKWAQKAITQ
jgi:hypothetical protein